MDLLVGLGWEAGIGARQSPRPHCFLLVARGATLLLGDCRAHQPACSSRADRISTTFRLSARYKVSSHRCQACQLASVAPLMHVVLHQPVQVPTLLIALLTHCYQQPGSVLGERHCTSATQGGPTRTWEHGERGSAKAHRRYRPWVDPRQTTDCDTPSQS